MTRFVYLIAFLGLAVSLMVQFFDRLPGSPFAAAIDNLIIYLETIATGRAWLAWFFPINDLVLWIPGFINALIAFFTVRATLFILSLHV